MALIYGQPNKNVTGTNQADEIHLNGKADAHGKAGDDTIFGSEVFNRIHGQDGNDTIYTGADYSGGVSPTGDYPYGGKDSAWGERGNDTLIGSYRDDFLDGGDGNDTLTALGGNDYLRGGPGDDRLVFQDTDRLFGTRQFDGGSGKDTLEIITTGSGLYTEIRMTGESKGVLGPSSGLVSDDFEASLHFTGINEIINTDTSYGAQPLLFRGGGNSDMTVVSSNSSSVFIGGDGYETFTGGYNSDQFIFKFDDHPEHRGRLAMGHDVITDFQEGIDTLAFQGGEGKMTTTAVEHDGMTTFNSYDLHGNLIHVLDPQIRIKNDEVPRWP
jgi:Ca2+-binding RTX toxin-like protein